MRQATAHTGAPREVSTTANTTTGRQVRPLVGERITVALIPATADQLRQLQARTNMSKTDITNRAITSYEFFDAQMKSGRDLIVHDPRTGESQVVRFL